MVALQLDYPVTRSFKWPWFAPLAFLGAFTAIVFLTVINVALTGYETITIFNGNFNFTETHWYHQFMPSRSPKPGTLCESHVFNIGDDFLTNYAIFEWTMESITTPNAGDSGIAYKGVSLKDCDVASVFINGDMRTWTVDFTVVISCQTKDEFEVTARTSFTQTFLPGLRRAALIGSTRSGGNQDPRSAALDSLAQTASEDIGLRLFSAISNSNNTSTNPLVVSIQADFAPCPASVGSSASCANEAPQFSTTFAAVIYPNLTLAQYSQLEPTSPGNPKIIDAVTAAPLANLIQLVYASIRIDLGNPSPNNFIINPSTTNKTLTQSFPRTPVVEAAESKLYQRLTTGHFRPVVVEDPATIRVVYLCRAQKQKGAGPLFIAVLVATLSMFSSGWAVFMFLATYIAKRPSEANLCDGHPAERASPSPEYGGSRGYDFHQGDGEIKSYKPVAS